MKRLLDKKVESFEYVTNICTNYAHIADIAKLFKTYVNEKRKTNKGFALNQNQFTKMTIKQLEELQSLLPEVGNDKNFISSYFSKAFETELLTIPNSEEMSTEEYKAILNRMYDWVKTISQSGTYMSFASQIVREKLQTDLEKNKFDKETFLLYLNNPNNKLGVFDKTHQIKLQSQNSSYDSFWHGVHRLKVNEWTDETKLIEDYLRYFFKDAKDFGEFEKYFTPDFLKKQFYTAKIQAGENIDNIT